MYRLSKILFALLGIFKKIHLLDHTIVPDDEYLKLVGFILDEYIFPSKWKAQQAGKFHN